MSLDNLISDVLDFIQGTPNAELWAYYSAYDHVVLCQLFGAMSDLPAGVPMLTEDVQQHWKWFGGGKPLPDEPWKLHHAMDDARWTRDAFYAIGADEQVKTISAIIEETDLAVSPGVEIIDAEIAE
jgi:hypothetical protein